MKKMILLFLAILLVIGCENRMNTPISRVENFFHKYQDMDKEVLEELDSILEKDSDMSDKQKEKYKDLFIRQYQNLSYQITKEEVIGDTATVKAEIEVFNYRDAIRNAEDYYLEHLEEFTVKDYLDYKLGELEKVNGTIQYQLTMNLEKKDGIWTISEVSDDIRQKIHGLY